MPRKKRPGNWLPLTVHLTDVAIARLRAVAADKAVPLGQIVDDLLLLAIPSLPLARPFPWPPTVLSGTLGQIQFPVPGAGPSTPVVPQAIRPASTKAPRAKQGTASKVEEFPVKSQPTPLVTTCRALKKILDKYEITHEALADEITRLTPPDKKGIGRRGVTEWFERSDIPSDRIETLNAALPTLVAASVAAGALKRRKR